MSRCDKRRNYNERTATQRRSVITLQETRTHDENRRKKEDKEDTKNVDRLNLSKNRKRVDNATRLNRVASQAEKRKHCTSRDKLRDSCSSEKISDISEEIASSACVVRKSFAILAHEVRITLNINKQKTIIKKLETNNAKLHEDLKMLRVA